LERSFGDLELLEDFGAFLEFMHVESELWWAEFDIGRYFDLPTFVLRVGGLNWHFGAINWCLGAFGAL